MMETPPQTAWSRGRLDGKAGAFKLLFGQMYEDANIELGAFVPGGRIFCIASAGCMAMALAPRHEVVAVDINPTQLEYAAQRFAGMPCRWGVAERIMAFGRRFAPLAGWQRGGLREFLDLENPSAQISFWRQHLDTRRFRAGFDALFSIAALRSVYAGPFLGVLPPRPGSAMRRRLERGFARHPNRGNHLAHALLLGEMPPAVPPKEAGDIRLVHADAATFLAEQPGGSFDGFTLSNILDGAGESYQRQLLAAVKHAARPGAVFVMRSFREPQENAATNHAADDRAMLWGTIEVRPVASL
jgi:hypothetical protein